MGSQKQKNEQILMLAVMEVIKVLRALFFVCAYNKFLRLFTSVNEEHTVASE